VKVTILAVGSRGDVQPYVALGQGLAKIGHRVRLAAYLDYEPLVRRYGLDFAPLRVDLRQLLESGTLQAWLETGRNPLAFVTYLGRMAGDMLWGMLADCWDACLGSDGIVFSNLGFAGYHIAERLGVPCLSAVLQPMGRTRAFPSVTTPRVLPLGGLGNLLTHTIEEQLLWQTVREPVNRWRRETLGLRPLSWRGPFAAVYAQRVPYLFGYSPHVLAKPADWPSWYDVTGYWFLDRPPEWQPPADLVAFLQAGPAPVYVGMGSIRPRHPNAFLALAVEALRGAGRRGVLLSGYSGNGSGRLAEDMYVVQDVPHDWLFPQMAAVVHHGGAGTTAAALRAGVPSVTIPFFADQPFWARRSQDLGVALPPLPRKGLSVQRLAAAIHDATGDADLRAHAAALGERIRAEDGVATAAKLVDQHLRAQAVRLL